MGTARGRPRDNVDFLGVTFRRDVLRLQLIPLPLSTSQLQSAELPHELASTGESHSRRLCGGSGVHEQENRAHEVGGVQVDAVGTRWRTTSQDGLLLNSRCTLYKSAIEEVTIWGWPLQTAGLLTNGFSSRTFTLLSGRVTQWNGGQVGYLIRRANASWVQPKWGASAVQLDPNTWVLEYQRSYIFDGTRLYSAALEFLKYRISRIVARLKKDFWLFVAFEDKQYNGFTVNNGPQIPT